MDKDLPALSSGSGALACRGNLLCLTGAAGRVVAVTSTAPTTAAGPGGSTEADEGEPPATRWPRLSAALRRPLAADLGVALLFVIFAGWLTHGLWPDPATRVLALNPEDQTLYEWFLAHDSRILSGHFGLVTDRLNAPDGVNLMANTSVIAIGALLAPVTVAFGAPVTFALVVAANLALTAIAWYVLYARALRLHRAAAALGALLCGFGPGMVSQSNSHLHIGAQWLVPAIVFAVIKMARAADPEHADGGPGWRRRLLVAATGLAVLVTVQVFVGEEVLFLAAVTLALFAAAYAVADRAFARRVLPLFAPALLVTAGAAGLALAYPLTVQFAGPGSVPNGLFSPDYFSADLASYPAISALSALGSEGAARLTTGPSEYNTFLGWPLLLVAVGCAWWLRRRPVVVASAVAGSAMAWLSLGPRVVVDGVHTGIWAPYALLRDVPVVDGALPMRFALALLPLIGTVLAVAIDRALRAGSGAVRFGVPVLIAAALLPVVPAPLPTADRPPVPAFIADGYWRRCVEPGGVLVPVPLPTPKQPYPMRWAAAANAEFAIPEGFFIGPYAAGGRASMGTAPRPTSKLLAQVAETGRVPAVGPDQVTQARRDVDFWGASCVALASSEPHAEPLRATLERLFGPASAVADAWVWRVGR
jgi:hypothetical protein